MSEKTRSVKSKDLSDEEAREYLLEYQGLENEKAKLENEKQEVNKSLNNQIKGVEGKIDKLRNLLNDGILITLHNFMDSGTREIIWKDEEGNEIERTPWDDEDWKIWQSQNPPKTLFDEKETTAEYSTRPELPAPEEDIIDGEGEDVIPEDCDDTDTEI